LDMVSKVKEKGNLKESHEELEGILVKKKK
jgi:hypothetical protein